MWAYQPMVRTRYKYHFLVLTFIPILSLALPMFVQGATPSELLDKAIYTEETVGDLDEAIKLYGQVVAQAADAKQAAARAQFRLALCYRKQGNSGQAQVAFQRLVAEFPEAKELVAEARQLFAGETPLLPAPWGKGDEMVLNMKLTTGADIGTMIYGVRATRVDDRDVWECWTRGLVTINDANSFSRVSCDKDTFRPIRSLWRHSLLGEATAVFHDGTAEVQVPNSEKQVIPRESESWDNEQAFQVFRRLPLKVGYHQTMHVISSLGSAQVPLILDVPEMETITTPAGTFECFKLTLNIGQVFWISQDEHRYVVRFQAGTVSADLVQIKQQSHEQNSDERDTSERDKEKESATTHSFEGLKVTLPVGWRAYEPKSESQDRIRRMYLLDRYAESVVELFAGPIESLKENQRSSPRAWTDSFVAEMSSRLTDFQVRDSGIRDLEVDGRPATSIIADHTSSGAPVAIYGLATFGKETAAGLRARAPKDQFEGMLKEVESIVKSLRWE